MERVLRVLSEVHLVYSFSWVAQMLGQALYSWDSTWQEGRVMRNRSWQTREGVGTRQILSDVTHAQDKELGDHVGSVAQSREGPSPGEGGRVDKGAAWKLG